MLIPYTVDVPMARLPVANWLLIVLTSVLSLLILTGNWPKEARQEEPKGRGSQRELDQTIREYKQTFARDTAPRPLALKPGAFSFFQLFTHLFVHANFFHLLGNMIFLFCFGNAVNAKLGHGLFLGSYLLLGAVAGLAWLLLGTGQPVVGASGAIMGVVGIFLVLFPRNDVNLFYWFGAGFAGSLSLGALWLILLYMAGDLLGTLVDGGGGVAYLAHLAGAFTGVGLGLSLLQAGLAAPTDYEENLLQMLGWQEKKERYPEPEPQLHRKRR